MAKPGLTYLLVHEGLNALKVGVTAKGSSRTSNFQRHGWEVVGKEHFTSGFQAVFVEQDILKWWREDLKLSPYLTSDLMPLGGFTETVDLQEVPPAVAIMRLETAAERARDTAGVLDQATS
jgi:hypothetical protein